MEEKNVLLFEELESNEELAPWYAYAGAVVGGLGLGVVAYVAIAAAAT